MSELEFPNGLTEMGYTTDDIPAMVAGAMPQVGCYPHPPVAYATDRSKAVILVLFLFCVALWFYYGAFHVESFLALCSRFLVILVL